MTTPWSTRYGIEPVLTSVRGRRRSARGRMRCSEQDVDVATSDGDEQRQQRAPCRDPGAPAERASDQARSDVHSVLNRRGGDGSDQARCRRRRPGHGTRRDRRRARRSRRRSGHRRGRAGAARSLGFAREGSMSVVVETDGAVRLRVRDAREPVRRRAPRSTRFPRSLGRASTSTAPASCTEFGPRLRKP